MTHGDDSPGWTRVLDRIDALQRGSELLAVLRGAADAGLLRALTEPVDVATVVAHLGLRVERAQAALELLGAHDIAVESEGRWRLSDDWIALVAGDTPFALPSLLGMVRIRGNHLEAALSDACDYWQLSEADRLTVARGVSFNPASDVAVASVRSGLATMDGVAAALDAGGAVLELGCGVGSRLTTLMRAFPQATAVGVELAEDLVAYG